MENKQLYYKEIYEYVPCQYHGKLMANTIEKIKAELQSDDLRVSSIDKLIVSIKNRFSDREEDLLSDIQLRLFLDVQREMLKMLS